MSKRRIKTFCVLKDTREQNGWNFTSSASVTDVISKKLDTGDYTVDGFQNLFTIERKFSTAEVARNVLEPRFKYVLQRLAEFKYKFIICEFTLENVLEYPFNAGIPQARLKDIRLKPEFLLSCLSKIQVDYRIPVIFAGTKRAAEQIAVSLMKRIVP